MIPEGREGDERRVLVKRRSEGRDRVGVVQALRSEDRDEACLEELKCLSVQRGLVSAASGRSVLLEPTKHLALFRQ